MAMRVRFLRLCIVIAGTVCLVEEIRLTSPIALVLVCLPHTGSPSRHRCQQQQQQQRHICPHLCLCLRRQRIRHRRRGACPGAVRPHGGGRVEDAAGRTCLRAGQVGGWGRGSPWVVLWVCGHTGLWVCG